MVQLVIIVLLMLLILAMLGALRFWIARRP